MTHLDTLALKTTLDTLALKTTLDKYKINVLLIHQILCSLPVRIDLFISVFCQVDKCDDILVLSYVDTSNIILVLKYAPIFAWRLIQKG